jgi:O-antigen ligase/polysaccharide polymerase Wzy-like membrane protein/tetratricopeptide repeat protein
VRRFGSFAASALLGAAFTATAFAAGGGDLLDRSTTVEIGLVLASGAVVATAVARAHPGRVGGTVALGAFVAYAALTAISILWSIDPNLTWVEANRTLAYLAVFGAALAAAHLAPDGYAVVLRAILIAGFAICGYALLSRAFPGSLASTEIYARLGAPYGYWNALGTTAALSIPAALWLGARRSGHAPANALAYPLLALFLAALFLSYSRGAIAAALIGTLVWIWYVPLRLRTITLLAVASAGAAPVILWALTKDAFTKNQVPLDVRRSVASAFGVFVLATGLLMLVAGLAIVFRVAVRPPRARARLRAGVAAGTVACLVPIGLFTALSLSDRGFSGTVRTSVEALTSPTSKTPGGPSRLTVASSSRARYWTEAGHVFADNAAAGTGAGTFGVARLRFRTSELVSGHAHGFVVQTMSDLGIVGLTVVTLLTAAWLAAAARAVGFVPRGPPRPFDAERAGLVALALCALVFGLQSAIDWTWFVQGPTVMAVAAAGFVAGRAILGSRRPASLVAQHLGRVPRYALVAASAIAALVCAWTIYQPQRSDAETGHALDLLDKHQLAAAGSAADHARRIDPLSPDPMLAAAAIDEARGDRTAALAVLVKAVRRFPGEPQVWTRLAEYQLDSLARPADALRTIKGALYLDPRSRAAQQVYLAATRALEQSAAVSAARPRAAGRPGG